MDTALIGIYDDTADLCSTTWERAQVEYAGRPLDSLLLQNYCFEGLYAFEILTYGFGLAPDSSQVLFVDQLYGVEVSWALGGMVHQVEFLGL
jgi:hypothetical protein